MKQQNLKEYELSIKRLKEKYNKNKVIMTMRQQRSENSVINSQDNNKSQNTSFKLIKLEYRKNKMKLWTDTAGGMTRERSPVHKIPQAKRWTSIDQQKSINSQALKIQLNLRMKPQSKTITFPKSERKNNFLYKDQQNYPSPATYTKARYLDNSYYKRNLPRQQYNLLTIIPKDNSRITDLYSYKLSQHKATFGKTFAKFSNHQKQYLPHAKNMFYQPQLLIDNPGIGSYQIREKIAKQKPAYSMRLVLKRFIDQLKVTPGNGPAAYNPQQSQNYLQKKSIPSSVKGTFDESQRTYLRHPQNCSPGPCQYQIKRYLDKTIY